jgi:hypothetical protein
MFQACTLLSNGQVPQGYDLSYIPLNILDNEETELKDRLGVMQYPKKTVKCICRKAECKESSKSLLATKA